MSMKYGGSGASFMTGPTASSSSSFSTTSSWRGSAGSFGGDGAGRSPGLKFNSSLSSFTSYSSSSTLSNTVSAAATNAAAITTTNPPASASTRTTWTLKCTDLPQFDALQAQADLFRSDDKLHLRNLCNDSSRCAALTAIHYSGGFGSGDSNNNNNNDVMHRRMILDYSRQRVVGETMELLFDLADAVGLTDRREALRLGHAINVTSPACGSSHHAVGSGGGQAVLHFLLRQPLPPTADDNSNNNNNNNNGSNNTNNRNSNNNNNNNNGQDGYHVPHYYNFNNRENHAFMTNQLKQIWTVRQQVADFVKKVHNGTIKSCQGLPLVNTLVICSTRGGYQSGAECVAAALESCGHACSRRQLRFLSCCDPTQVARATQDWNPAETLVVLILLDYYETPDGDPDVLLNARAIQAWVLQHYEQLGLQQQQHQQQSYRTAAAKGMMTGVSNNNNNNNNPGITKEQVLGQHFCAVLWQGDSYAKKCQQQFGIGSPERLFAVGYWVNPRYSLCSAAGLLPLSLQFTCSVMDQVLAGAHDMDEHFFESPLRDNIPIVLGLLGVWNSTFLGYSSRAILPYADGLRLFAAHVQQVDMESNGKRVALDGTPLLHQSGEIHVTTAPYISQQSLFQLLHQGRVIPVDFIGFMQSSAPLNNNKVVDNTTENNAAAEENGDKASVSVMMNQFDHHDELMSRFFAEPDALAYGKTLVDLIQEGTPDSLREHMVVAGNRPSSSLLLTKLDAFSMGQLLALYEHRTAVQGFLWGINSFDQFGTELGRNLAKTVKAQLSASRKTGASVQGFNSSTSALLEQYLAHGKRLKQQQQQKTVSTRLS